MNIIENKHGKFDIDTVEGAEKYLESEGVNVAEYVQKGIDELKKHNKILNTDKADTNHVSKVLNIPRVMHVCPLCSSTEYREDGREWIVCTNPECDWRGEMVL